MRSLLLLVLLLLSLQKLRDLQGACHDEMYISVLVGKLTVGRERAEGGGPVRLSCGNGREKKPCKKVTATTKKTLSFLLTCHVPYRLNVMTIVIFNQYLSITCFLPQWTATQDLVIANSVRSVSFISHHVDGKLAERDQEPLHMSRQVSGQKRDEERKGVPRGSAPPLRPCRQGFALCLGAILQSQSTLG